MLLALVAFALLTGHAAAVTSAHIRVFPLGGGDGPQGNVTLVVAGRTATFSGTLTGLSPFERHAIALHEWADLVLEDGPAAVGGRWNPDDSQHGCPPEDGAPPQPTMAGDLGNVEANGQGVAEVSLQVTDALELTGARSVVGRAFVVHAEEDSCESAGDEWGGAATAAGVIGIRNADDQDATFSPSRSDDASLIGQGASCVFQGIDRTVSGFARIYSPAASTIRVVVDVDGLPASTAFRVSIREFGDLSSFESLGPAFSVANLPPPPPIEGAVYDHIVSGNLESRRTTTDGAFFLDTEDSGQLALYGESGIVGRSMSLDAVNGGMYARCVIGLSSADEVDTRSVVAALDEERESYVAIWEDMRGESSIAHVVLSLEANEVYTIDVTEESDVAAADGAGMGGAFMPLSACPSDAAQPWHVGDIGSFQADASGTVDAFVRLTGNLRPLVVAEENVQAGESASVTGLGITVRRGQRSCTIGSSPTTELVATGVLAVLATPQSHARAAPTSSGVAGVCHLERTSTAAASGLSPSGVVYFFPSQTELRVYAEIHGLGAEKQHGIEIRTAGDLMDLGATFLGVVYNENGGSPAAPPTPTRRAGDLGTFVVNGDGTAIYDRRISIASLAGDFNILGRGLSVRLDPLLPAASDIADSSIAMCTIGLARTTEADVGAPTDVFYLYNRNDSTETGSRIVLSVSAFVVAAFALAF